MHMISYLLAAKSFDTLEAARTRLWGTPGLACEISRMVTIKGKEVNPELYENGQVEFHLAIQAERHAPEEVRGFTVWMGRGCEAMTIGLALTDHGLVFDGACETYGDLTPSMEVFEHRHVTVCKVFDIIQEAGMSVDVMDTSGYWKSRSLSDLRGAGNDIHDQLDKMDKAKKTSVGKLVRRLYGYQSDVRPS